MVDVPTYVKYFASYNKKGGQNGLVRGRFVSTGRSSILAGLRFVNAVNSFASAGRNFELAGQSFVKKGCRFVNTGGNFIPVGRNIEKAVRSFEPYVGRLLLTAFSFGYFTVLNSSLLTCLY